MKNAGSRENERDDKFLEAAGRIDEALREDPERGGPRFTARATGPSPARGPARLRPVNYAELFTDLSPSPLLLYLRETKSDGKYRERVNKGGQRICRRWEGREKGSLPEFPRRSRSGWDR